MKPRVEIVSFYHGLCGMRVCAEKDVTDAEVLDACNSGNPAGTQGGWMEVKRTGDPKDGGPISCKDDSGRLHLVVVC